MWLGIISPAASRTMTRVAHSWWVGRFDLADAMTRESASRDFTSIAIRGRPNRRPRQRARYGDCGDTWRTAGALDDGVSSQVPAPELTPVPASRRGRSVAAWARAAFPFGDDGFAWTSRFASRPPFPDAP